MGICITIYPVRTYAFKRLGFSFDNATDAAECGVDCYIISTPDCSNEESCEIVSNLVSGSDGGIAGLE